MRRNATLLIAMILAGGRAAWALDPNQILVVANTEYPASTRLARYYCQARGIPSGNVLPVAVGAQLRDSISRADYDRRLAGPIRRTFATREDLSHIQCLVMTYGVPFKVGPREPPGESDTQLAKLREALQEAKDAIAQSEPNGETDPRVQRERQFRVAQLQMDIDRVSGVQTDASVDSELALVLRDTYELYRWQPNLLRTAGPHPYKTFMISRLDGPSYDIAKGLIDKAIAAEKTGLAGNACIDSRGLTGKDLYSRYDQSLSDLAVLTRLATTLTVQEERTSALFQPGSCSQTALYCGWYSLARYVDAFDFVEGAVGFHIASYEAASLRDPNSTHWCPAMLKDGITATLGPVTEPYLHAFPEPRAFFGALFDGRCLVEAYYLTQPFNSWQMLLIGDPLYTPFPKKGRG